MFNPIKVNMNTKDENIITHIKEDFNLKKGFSSHDPILIEHDSDFHDYGFPGNGTDDDPYIIENLNLTTEETSQASIRIGYITQSFIIRNCYFETSIEDSYGILLFMLNSELIAIYNNTIISFDHAIIISECWDVLLSNNTLINNSEAIRISSSNKCKMINNTFQDCGTGIVTMGIFSVFSVINNTFINSGLSTSFLYAENSTVRYNTVNGKELGWFVNIANLTFIVPIYGQIYLINCSNAVIKNQILCNTTLGLYAHQCDNLKLQNNTMSYNYQTGSNCVSSNNMNIEMNRFGYNGIYGLAIFNSQNSSITGNNISSNIQTGLTISNSDSLSIDYNTITNNGEHGIDTLFSTNGEIADNYITNNIQNGINIERTESILITNNAILSNGFRGIYISVSDFCMIRQNNISANQYGIYFFDYSSSNGIVLNQISFNELYGVCMKSWGDELWFFNFVVYNSFIDNNLMGTSQAYQDRPDSEFLNNYWSDHTEPDIDDDNIVDTKYEIQGKYTNDDYNDPEPLTIEATFLSFPPLFLEVTGAGSCAGCTYLDFYANVIDDVKIESVLFFYRINRGNWQNTTTTVDGYTYRFSLGPFNKTSTVNFYFVAQDNVGHTTQSIVYTSKIIFDNPNPPTETSTNTFTSPTSDVSSSLLIATICSIISFQIIFIFKRISLKRKQRDTQYSK